MTEIAKNKKEKKEYIKKKQKGEGSSGGWETTGSEKGRSPP